MLAVHAEQLAEHGGLAGIRDEARRDAALDRPRNLLSCGEPDIFDLAAAYAFGFAKGHAFVDGNKRMSFVAAEVFLMLNGYALRASDADCVVTWLGLADGSLSEARLADWMRVNTESVS
ncbi:type II toxin-antitoxin system death-on-curing family toxin [Pelagibacterium halotolerans]|uniref:type II toxin-antitoxin system death-on-curing family toxin n=1 Tax=Pelagibacterium halotolerans TaxID=531813 RepID=UPI00384B3B90